MAAERNTADVASVNESIPGAGPARRVGARGVRGPLALGVAGATLFVAGACGGGSDSSAHALLDRLAEPDGASVTAVVDVERVRTDLGIEPDAGPEDIQRAMTSDDPAERHLGLAVAAAFPAVNIPYESAFIDVLDASRITAVASGGIGAPVDERVTVLATDQPFEELAGELEGSGYTRDDDLLVAGEDQPEALRAVAGGDGVLAVGHTAEVVAAAVRGENEGVDPSVAELIETLDAPATAVLTARRDSCVEAVAVTDDIEDGNARLVVVTDSPDPGRAVPAAEGESIYFDDLRVGTPEADGDLLITPLVHPGYAREGRTLNPLLIVAGGEMRLEELYDCA